MEHPSRLNFSFAPERIERLKATPEFQEIATSKKKGKGGTRRSAMARASRRTSFSSLATWMAGGSTTTGTSSASCSNPSSRG